MLMLSMKMPMLFAMAKGTEICSNLCQ